MYIRLIIILRFLCILECSANPNYMGRIYSFLRQPYVHGESELAENIISDMENQAAAGLSMASSQILGVDFLPLLSDDDDDVPMKETVQEEPDNFERKRSFKGLKDAFMTALSKLPEPLQNIVTHFRENFEKEMTSMMNVTKKEETKEQLDLQLTCNQKKEDCLAIDDFGVRCMIDCLTKNNQLVNKYSGHIAKTLRLLCEPIGTDYATLYENMGKDSQGSPMEGFLRAMKSGPMKEQLAPAAKKGANSLLYLMVTGVATSMLPMGVVCEEMKALLTKKSRSVDMMKNGTGTPPAPIPPPPPPVTGPNGNSSSPVPKPLPGNPLCIPAVLVDETFQMSQVFEREPTLLDVILPGYNTVVTMVKYVPGDHQLFYSGFMEAFEIMTGTTCGLVSRAEGGMPDCNQIGGFPRPGVPMPEVVRRKVTGWEAFCKGFKDGLAASSGLKLPQIQPTRPPTLGTTTDEQTKDKPRPKPIKPSGGGVPPTEIPDELPTDSKVSPPTPPDGDAAMPPAISKPPPPPSSPATQRKAGGKTRGKRQRFRG